MRKAFSLLLSVALIALAPGIEGYSAFAAMVRSGGIPKTATPRTSFSGRSGAVRILRLSAGSLSLSSPGLKSILPQGAPSPNIQPTALPLMPIAAPEARLSVSLPPTLPTVEAPGASPKIAEKSPVTVSAQLEGGAAKLSRSRTPASKSRILSSLFHGTSKGLPGSAVFGKSAAPLPSATPGLSLTQFGPTDGGSASYLADLKADELAGLADTPDKAILQDLVENPPAALIFDYDNTLVDRSPTGLSGNIRNDVLKGLIRLLQAGIPVGLISARNFDNQPSDAPFPQTLWEPLVSKIPAHLRRNLFVSGGVGAELVLFTKKGKPIRHLNGDWAKSEKVTILGLIDGVLQRLGISEEDIVVVKETPAQIVVKFKTGDMRGKGFSEKLTAAFKRAGIDYPIHHNKEFVYFSKFTKGRGISLIYTAMRTRGHPVTEKNLAIVGDEFRLPHGGDTAMAQTFPNSRAYTVGDLPEYEVPSNVRRLEIRGGLGSLSLTNAALEGHSKNPLPAQAIKKNQVLRLLLAAALGSAITFAAPWLWGSPQVAAIGGTVMLSAIGLPQIYKNFRQGAKGTKDLAIKSYLIWFAASVFLTIASVLQGSSFWWIAANVAGVVESLAVILQLNFHKKGKEALKSLLSAAAPLSLLIPISLGLWLAPAAWASVAFFSAMALLLVLNMPQILQNFTLYEKEGRAPEGLAPLYPALVVLGSLLHLFVAATSGDLFWMINGVLAITTAGIVLLQIYAPLLINPLLGPFIRAYLRLKGKKA